MTPLERSLYAEAAVNLPAGLVAAVAAAPLGRLFGDDLTSVVRVVGVVLALWAVDVALVARTRPAWHRPLTLAALAANAAWLVGSVVLALSGIEAAGVVVLAAVAVPVAGLALVQQRALRQQPAASTAVRASAA